MAKSKFSALMFFCFLSFFGCSTTETGQTNEASEEKPKTDSSQEEYAQIIDKFTGRAQLYVGFTNIFQTNGTLLNDEILARQLRKKAAIYGWTDKQLQEERANTLKSTATETQVFIGFFAADPAHDDLSTENSVWRVILDTNGKRFTGKVKKNKNPLAELAELYPYLDRWSTPYLVTFSVPLAEVEGAPSQMTITGPLGEGKFNFPGLKLSEK